MSVTPRGCKLDCLGAELHPPLAGPGLPGLAPESQASRGRNVWLSSWKAPLYCGVHPFADFIVCRPTRLLRAHKDGDFFLLSPDQPNNHIAMFRRIGDRFPF